MLRFVWVVHLVFFLLLGSFPSRTPIFPSLNAGGAGVAYQFDPKTFTTGLELNGCAIRTSLYRKPCVVLSVSTRFHEE